MGSDTLAFPEDEKPPVTRLHQRLQALPRTLLKDIRRGIEKESLRAKPDGTLADTPHPQALGSALTHPRITTDFSESQLELITGVHDGVLECLEELGLIHQFVYRSIGSEILWCASMPCNLPAEESIPIGRYGTSNVGRTKTVYRNGLAWRYGKRMQMISGIHYNFSVPEATWSALPGGSDPNTGYFGLIRNFRRHAWLLLYLFGASPAVCSTFVEGRDHGLEQLRPGTLYRPHATSLRMGPLGYQSDAQASLAVSYNTLKSYGASLEDALTRPYPEYEAIGLRQGNDYRQLATSLLQIENEFYGTIRPKRTTRQGERPLHALRDRGVEYVEVRLMDLDPFVEIGIGASTVRFLDMFLLHCLLSDSPPDSPAEIAAMARNQHRVAARGREPGLRLERDGGDADLVEWGGQVLAECEPIAAALDEAHGNGAYAQSLRAAMAALDDPATAPSARVLKVMKERHEGSYVRFVLAQSLAHRSTLLSQPLSRETEQQLIRAAEASLEEQRAIESGDVIDFETYRQRYLDHSKLI
jgi:glutamate--cysteine ligase